MVDVHTTVDENFKFASSIPGMFLTARLSEGRIIIYLHAP